MARFRPLTHDPIRSQLASAIETARLFGVLDALSGSGMSRGPRGAPGYDFTDDPLSSGGFAPDDQTIRVRPGPVRTTLIRPTEPRSRSTDLRPRLTDRDGHVFNDPRLRHSHRFDDPVDWIESFINWFDLERKPDPFHLNPDEPPRFKYVFNRAIAPRFMNLEQVEDTVVFEGAADGLILDRDQVGRVIVGLLGPERVLDKDDVGPVSITLQFVPKTWHLNKPDDPTAAVQVQAQYQLNICSEKTPGNDDVLTLDFALQAQAQFNYNTQTKQITGFQWLDGGQLSSTQKKVLGEFIDLQEFVQLLDGVTFQGSDPPTKNDLDRNTRSKTVESAVTSVLQAAAGFQVNFNLSKHLILFIQIQGSVTGDRESRNATFTLDGTPFSVGFQVTF